MHSFGGLVGSCAVKGLLSKDQSNGKGVVSLVYLAAGIPMEGMSFMDATGGNHASWCRLVNVDGSDSAPVPNTSIWCAPDKDGVDPGQLFFADCDDATREEAVKRLSYWSEGNMWSKATFAAWQEVESNYLMCTEDQGLPFAQQQMMTQIPRGKWKLVEQIEAGHSPFLSKPEETVKFVRRCCGEEV